MFAHAFRFDTSRLNARFNGARFHGAFAPRKPRHPLGRLAMGLLGLGVLALLVFFSVFVGIAMLTVGLVYRLLRPSKPGLTSSTASPRARVVDGEYRIVAKTILPSA
jgi:hypothetical protein